LAAYNSAQRTLGSKLRFNDCTRTSSGFSGILPLAIRNQALANLTELAKIARRLWNNLANTAKMQDQHQEDAVKNLSVASSVCSGAC
jgi:hypothetical protein